MLQHWTQFSLGLGLRRFIVLPVWQSSSVPSSPTWVVNTSQQSTGKWNFAKPWLLSNEFPVAACGRSAGNRKVFPTYVPVSFSNQRAPSGEATANIENEDSHWLITTKGKCSPGLATGGKYATRGSWPHYLGLGTLLGAPGLATRSLRTLLGAPGLTTRSKDATRGSSPCYWEYRDATRGSWPYHSVTQLASSCCPRRLSP